MEFDWTTFILEIANFLILVWILKRFLYHPVLDVIARRRTQIEQSLSEARETQEQSSALKIHYENRLADWEREKAGAQTRLSEEIAAERKRLMQGVSAAVEEETQKQQAIVTRRQEEWLRAAAEQGVAQGRLFASRLLARAASPELETRLFEMLLEDLARLPAAETQALAAAGRNDQARIGVASAFPLDAERRARLGAALNAAVGRELPADFSELPELGAGLRVTIGPWVMHANLGDELAFFGELGRHD